ncbi:PREDICTED: DNA replication ATP-dependent helicase/nuclease DNA2 [Eufriesea mexicana]|uniref:DNA replication ATP-dependent helicase/nuclease DNA2 n=1 Tax=Eufriesea mexicana TaxID=516756 RepID=UPI00083BCED0|nr:PREDICTED: DNA replication ATP-dependent helicase/nuclease DNA2 [Eufriesea mexicana]
MKKVDLSLKKNSIHDTKQSQRKISVYFMKTPKNLSLKKNNSLNNIVESSTIDDEIHKKRKISDDLGSLQIKVAKYDDVPDACNAGNAQRQKHVLADESNVIHHVFDSNISIGTNKTKCDYMSVIEHDLKENIGIDQYADKLYKSNDKKVIKHDGILQDNNSDKCLSKEHKTDSMEEYVHDNIKHEEICSELGSFLTDDFNDYFEEDWSIDTQINFNSLQRCKVVEVRRDYNSLLLTVSQEDYKTPNTTITCSGFWKDAKVQKDDIVVVQARKENKQWIIDNNSGFLVVHPDILISGTTVAGALFCKRKAVLAEKFRKMENLPYYEGDKSPLVIGSLVHQLLQGAVQKNIHELSDITKLMDSILQSKDTSSLLYASEISLDVCRQQMLVFVPKIHKFIQHYIKGKRQQEINNMQSNFKGKISHIRDIEENIWLPKLGIKGKVDVTVEVKINSKKKIMPLEIKTGKPSFSLEHRGQIILYIMMMTLTGQDTDTGLLLYLRENSIQEINSGYPEKRDLILLRNTLASYFVPKSIEKITSLTSESGWQILELPEPINHHSACSKCIYSALCCAYLSKDTNIQLSDSHPLTKLGKQILDKFKPTHIDYILHWVSLLQIEESAQFSENIMKYLWTLSPEKREMKKTCICNLQVIGKVIECDSKYKHTFVRANVKAQFSNTNIPYMEFSDNEYILISTNTRINISAGFIVQRKEDSIIVLLDRDITKYNINESFHIDKYSSSSLFSSNLANVGGLMEHNKICEKLRDIIIDRKPASFQKGLSQSIIYKSAKILQNLNKNQQRAILKVISTNDYALIKGMPGTGKTETLVALIEVLHNAGHSILITAHTNSAVDNILLKLLNKGIDFLRLGSYVHPSLKYKTEGFAVSNYCSPNSLEELYSSKNIIGVTCYGAHHALLGRRIFDICLVDESTQTLQPSVLRPLYSAKKFVLVGDPDQLPPVIRSKLARKLGAEESLFARLDNENNTVTLTKQYRMNKNIMYLANKLTYNDMLVMGNTSLENATIVSLCKEVSLINKINCDEKWLQKTLSLDISNSVIILNTGCTSNLQLSYCDFSTRYPESDQVNSNIWEAVIISKLVQTLLKMDAQFKNIGIIAPYRAHVNLLKKVLTSDIEINTVDQYQGRDKEIIIYSCAKSLVNNSDVKEDLEVLGDHRRLTVALTRAKYKLIIIGDKNTLSRYAVFKKLFNLVGDKNIINLKDYCNDFLWENLVCTL